MKGNRGVTGQAALEFVMTYGWAILILLVASVLAWQFGLFSFSGRIAPGQTGFWGLTPVDCRITESGVLNISLANDVGANVTVNELEFRFGKDVFQDTDADGTVIEPGEAEGFSISNSEVGQLPVSNAGDRFDILVSIRYTDSRTSTEHRSSGRMWGSYEE